MEGDKIGALYALFLSTIFKVILKDQKILQAAELLYLKEDFSSWKTGIILTAYANGAVMDFYSNLGLPVIMEKTGVKYLHHAALDFDVGIYFESNGHGNLIYKQSKMEILLESINCLETIKSSLPDNLSEDIAHSFKSLENELKILSLWLSLANQGTGDAICNYLMVEASLAYLKMDLGLWNQMYKDLFSVNAKIKVQNKHLIKTNYAQTKMEHPLDLQNSIDSIVKSYPNGRAFLRPSGTEDVCRLYVEALLEADAKIIADKITNLVLQDKELNS